MDSTRNLGEKNSLVRAKSTVTHLPGSSEKLLKEQISAPSYLHFLKENEAPPFIIPEREIKPHLLIGTVITENEVVHIISEADKTDIAGLKKYISNILVNKKIVENNALSERQFLTSLVLECIDYAAQQDFSASKLACFLTIYLCTHKYFKWYYWQAPATVWKYFKELMIRHSIQDSPDGEEVFEPGECYDILTHFHTIYLTNLPLIHILTFSVHRLKFLWPYKPK